VTLENENCSTPQANPFCYRKNERRFATSDVALVGICLPFMKKRKELQGHAKDENYDYF
jgi:hypothetical protein